jgi:hypothetical protein
MSNKKWYPVIKICQKCGHEFKMGINGTTLGCDSCVGVIRDAEGVAWFPGETEMVLMDVFTGHPETINRPSVGGENAGSK